MGRTASTITTGVRATSESSIEISFAYNGRRCRERIKLKPTPANLRRAAIHRAEIIDAIERGEFDYAVTFPNSKHAKTLTESQTSSDAMTVKKWLDTYLKRCATHLKTSTMRDYKIVIERQLMPQFGSLTLPDVRRADIRAWCATLECSNKRISNILSIFRSAMQEAVDDELIELNPLKDWTFKRKEEVKKDDIDPFSEEEQAAILEKIERGHGHNMIKFAFWTGMRTSEIIALEWGDIDFVRGYVCVNKALTQYAKTAETTKTRAGAREIKILAPAMQALNAQKLLTFLRPDGRIFLNPRTGMPWIGDQAIRKTLWQPALKRAGVRYRRPYQTRHTYASMMLSAGESPMWVAQQMGHSSWLMIGRIYGRWIPDAAPEAGLKAVALFSHESQEKKMLSKMLA